MTSSTVLLTMRPVSVSYKTGTVTRPRYLGIRRRVGLAEKLEAIYRIDDVLVSLTEAPTTPVAQRIHRRQANRVFQALQSTHDDRAMRPWARPRNVEMVPSLGGELWWIHPLGPSPERHLQHVRTRPFPAASSALWSPSTLGVA